MIHQEHPTLQLLRGAPYVFHLIGSRFVGPHDPEKADYDFVMICDGWHSTNGPKAWLKEAGFKPQGKGYGPDNRLDGTHVWTTPPKLFPDWPSVDIFPMSKEEADRRLRFFALMKEVGHTSGGWLAKALKSERPAWPALWDCIAKMEAPK